MRAFISYGEMWYPIPNGDLIRIGSSAPCEIQLQQDPYVSRRHCSLAFVDGELTVADLNSSHGTYVNGILLKNGPQTLRDGDCLHIGTGQMVVRIGNSAPVGVVPR